MGTVYNGSALEEGQPIPAIVLARGYTGLGVLRSLAQAGIPAYVACPGDDLVTHSRWYRPTPGAMPWDGSISSDALELLRAMPLSKAVLIAGSDDAALWLAELAQSDLAGRFLVSSSTRATLEVLQDKTRFGEFLTRTQIPHPRTFPLHCRADLDGVPFGELDRVFLKPADSQKFIRALNVKGYWVNSRAELETSWSQLNAKGFQVVAQEYIPGSTSDHYFIDGFRDQKGVLSGLFARRRTRIYPRDFGNSSYCRSIPLSEVSGAVDSLKRLMNQLAYRGIFSAEFKRDQRNGEFRLIEVNTRAWWYVGFAAECGVNVCAMAYRDALGLPVEVIQTYSVGVGCVNWVDDFKAYITQSADSRDRTRLLTLLGQWARAHFIVFRWNDPKPGLAAFHQFRKQLKKTIARKF